MEDNKCPLCGFDLVDGKCPNAEIHLKPMCLNCCECVVNEDGNRVCNNSSNKAKKIEKMKEVLGDSYELDVNSVVLKPLPLKDVTKKCRQWILNLDGITGFYTSYLHS